MVSGMDGSAGVQVAEIESRQGDACQWRSDSPSLYIEIPGKSNLLDKLSFC